MEMKHIRQLRWYAADQHARIGQMYEDGVPYWVHLFVCELHAIAFNLGARVRRVCWAHDLPEDVKTSHAELRAAGWTSEEVGDIYRLTDEPAPTRAERKLLTLPKTALGGHFAVAPKLCDRNANLAWGLLSGSISKNRKYRLEYPGFRYHLFDRTDMELLSMWYYTDHVMELRPHRIKRDGFDTRPLRRLVDSWIANQEKLFNSDKVDLLPEWHKFRALLDEQYVAEDLLVTGSHAGEKHVA